MYIKNFITLLRRYTTSSLLNVVGMSVAFAAIYLIMVQVKHDLSYNRVIENSERIYRLEHQSWMDDGSWDYSWNRQVPDEMCAICPEIEAAGSFIELANIMYYSGDLSIKRNGSIENFIIQGGTAEPEILKVFPFEFIAGDASSFLTENDIILSESTAKRCNLSVGDQLHHGRNAESNLLFNVVGIYKDFPRPSTMAMSEGYICMAKEKPEEVNNWGIPYYVLLKEGASREEVEARMYQYVLDDCKKRGLNEEEAEIHTFRIMPRLMPINDLFFAEDTYNVGMSGSRTTTYTLIIIAVLILVISFINFVNFFFALIPSRIRVVNNYKIFGAPTWKLRLNFLFETIGLILVSLIGAAVVVVAFADTSLSNYISAPVAINENWILVAMVGLSLIIFGVLVSLYPSWYITKFSPAFVIKGDFSATRSGRILRYTLVGVQYTISITLIICALLIYRQHQYMLSRDMGFDKENVLKIEIPYEATNGWTTENGVTMDYTKRNALDDKLKQNPQIKDVAWGQGEFISGGQMQWSRVTEDGQHVTFKVYPVSWNFLQVMGIDVVEGRDFLPSDNVLETGALIFNEKAAKDMNLTIDSKIQGHISNMQTQVVGICKNFDFQSAQHDIKPYTFLVFGQYGWDLPRCAYIRTVTGADISRVREYINQTIMDFAPNVAPEKINVKFFNDEIEFIYQKEDKLSTLVTMFSFLSIIISIIGVLGLVLFETQCRRREIGIRRVHGASAVGILKMFNRKYLYIVAICSAVAIPISYFIIDRWMQQFVYRTEMSVWVYVVAVLAITIITVVTVSLRSWKAANENPNEAINN